MTRRRVRVAMAVALLAAALAACAGPGRRTENHNRPPAGEAALGTRSVPGGQPTRAEYERLQRRLIARGLMREDYAPPDAPFTEEDLLRDFLLVAFYETGAAPAKSGRADPRRLRRWEGPVRYRLYGSGYEPGDREEIAALMARIARLSGLSIREAGSREPDNFAIYLTTPGERDRVAASLARTDPGPARVFDIWRFADDAVCVFNIENSGGTLVRAHVFVGSEVTGLLRRSCFHEEIVQAMGLPNDDDRVRPSLFNDDEEFALFTEHDEILLRLLYHPAIRPGMTADAAAPVARRVLPGLARGERTAGGGKP